MYISETWLVREIGIGYGGQCRLLTSHLETPELYRLIDLPEVLGLSKKYLGQLGSHPVEFVDGTKLDTDIESDLVISNLLSQNCPRGSGNISQAYDSVR